MYDTLDIPQHFIVPEPNHQKALAIQKLRARDVGLVLGMLAAVDFHDDLESHTSEVGKVGTNRELAPKLVTQLPSFYLPPENGFRIRLILAENPCAKR